jgi:acetyl-CoA carboxylase biotin carboxyl carrier protein
MAEEVRTQVPGNIWKVLVKEGDHVSPGAGELMKTEGPHAARVGGTVKAVYITEGQEGVDAEFVAVLIE